MKLSLMWSKLIVNFTYIITYMLTDTNIINIFGELFH